MLPSIAIFAIVVCDLVFCVVLTHGQVNILRVTIAQDPKTHLGSRSRSRNRKLKITAIENLGRIELADDVAILETGAAGRLVGGDLSDDGSGGIGKIEEVCIFGRHVIHADTEISMMDTASLDDLVSGGLRHLGGDRKTSSSK